VLALIFLGEGLGVNEVLGGVVVMVGVLAISTASSDPPVVAQTPGASQAEIST
jgi:drug/metabolite transporter (DMT)-like permease